MLFHFTRFCGPWSQLSKHVAQELGEYGPGCSARCAVLLSHVIQDRLLLQREDFCVSVGLCAFVGAVRGKMEHLPGTDQHGFKHDTFQGWCSGGLDCFLSDASPKVLMRITSF